MLAKHHFVDKCLRHEKWPCFIRLNNILGFVAVEILRLNNWQLNITTDIYDWKIQEKLKNVNWLGR